LLQAKQDVRKKRLEPLKKFGVRAVSNSKPDDGGPAWLKKLSINEIFILCNNGLLVMNGVVPNRAIVCGGEADVKDVIAIMPCCPKKAGERRWELSID
jgi:hypothetical protein